MKFTVYEDRWLCGSIPHEGDQSRLLSSQSDKMCCMGFLAEECGVPENARRDALYFSSCRIAPFDDLLPEALRPRLSNGTYRDDRSHGDLASRIYHVNDDVTLRHDVRKKKLTELFAEAGVEVEFQEKTP